LVRPPRDVSLLNTLRWKDVVYWIKSNRCMLQEIVRGFKIPVISIALFTIAIVSYYTIKFRNYRWIDHDQFYSLKIRSIETLRGTIFVNEPIKITATYDNAKPFPCSIDSYLAVGDSLVKHSNNDTIFVYRKNVPSKWFVNHH
jgi:hypothetical protein